MGNTICHEGVLRHEQTHPGASSVKPESNEAHSGFLTTLSHFNVTQEDDLRGTRALTPAGNRKILNLEYALVSQCFLLSTILFYKTDTQSRSKQPQQGLGDESCFKVEGSEQEV